MTQNQLDYKSPQTPAGGRRRLSARDVLLGTGLAGVFVLLSFLLIGGSPIWMMVVVGFLVGFVGIVLQRVALRFHPGGGGLDLTVWLALPIGIALSAWFPSSRIVSAAVIWAPLAIGLGILFTVFGWLFDRLMENNYKTILIGRYLRRRRIAWIALVAVMLCTTMVIVVSSIMGGWLEMFKTSARGLTSDVVIRGNGLAGFPYYEEIIQQAEKDPDVVAGSPMLLTYGVINIQNRKTDAVRVKGFPLDRIGKVSKFPDSLYRQHLSYVEKGQTPPPPTWDVNRTFEVRLEENPEDLPLADPLAGRLKLDDKALADRVTWRPMFGLLAVKGRLSDEDRDKLIDLSRGSKVWVDAVRRIARESNWPGMIPSAGVIDIRMGKDRQLEGREAWKFDLWAKLTVAGVGTDQSFDPEKQKAERQYWMIDDSRTGMWQEDTKTVYVPFDILQRDLGMDARPVTQLVEAFAVTSPLPQRVLGKVADPGKFSLFQNRSPRPTETVELKAGDQIGFRKADDGHMVAVAGDRVIPISDDRKSVWKMHVDRIEPARCSEVQLKVKPGANLREVRQRLEKITADVFDHNLVSLRVGHDVNVETWDEASALYIGAIQKEKLLMTILFGIVSIVAIFLIGCIFYMIVAEKTKDIGIIKSVGATSSGVAGIFLGYGLAIGIVGALLGLLLSYLIVHNINEIHDWLGMRLGLVVWNPEVYAFDRIPNTLNPTETSIYVCIAVLASVIGAIVPAIRAAWMHPVEALRWE